jgi:hypothetical protein
MALDLNTPIHETLPDGRNRALYSVSLWPGLYAAAAAEAVPVV